MSEQHHPYNDNTASSNTIQDEVFLLKKFDELVNKSEYFETKIDFKTEENRIKIIAGNDDEKKKEIAKHAINTRVIIHERVQKLIDDFIKLKKEEGSALEKNIYAQMTVKDFVVRALTKRPLTFFGSNDITFLREEIDMPPPSDWNKVGTDGEGIIKITEYMTYDEIAISALIGVSVPTFFINKGGRNNIGLPEDDKQDYGIYVALTGARFEKRDKMESLHMLVSEVTDKHHGYGLEADRNSHQYKLLKIWAEFYEMKIADNLYGFPSFEEVKAALDTDESHDYHSKSIPDWIKYNYFRAYQPNPYSQQIYINVEVYKKRLAIILEPFLEEANIRAKDERKKAYIHAIGLGLGVWQICPSQAQWMIEVYEKLLAEGAYTDIDVIDFSWFPADVTSHPEITTKGGNKIKIIFSRRDPAQKLEDPNYLLVAMYAWDGNSFPGNEYWRGMLHASGDPAAACCSTIAELQNPEINVDFVNKIRWYPQTGSIKQPAQL